jgi:formylglycine-generating enzyme required for sulfatase activity
MGLLSGTVPHGAVWFVWVAAVLAGTPGCGGKRTEILLGVATDLSAPDVLDHVIMRVTRPDTQAEILHEEWLIPGTQGTKFELPGSFGIFTTDHSQPRIKVSVVGYRKDGGEVGPPRESVVSLVRDETLFMRLALVQRCMGISCGDGETCFDGHCKPQLVRSVSLPIYVPGREALAECAGPTVLKNTATKQALQTGGTGHCAPNEWCGESTCYKNQGQGLLFCAPPASDCNGVDGFETCALDGCTAQLQTCYGPEYRDGHFAGPCVDYAACRVQCNCDAACIARCDSVRAQACSSCLNDADACVAASTCTPPTCHPLEMPTDAGAEAGSPADMGLMADLAIPPGMVEIPSATFQMGCLADVDPDCLSSPMTSATPRHAVTVSTFRIDLSEVVQKDYKACVDATTCPVPMGAGWAPATTPDLPVTGVEWADAAAYCKFVGKRLPTEAEWELAARGTDGRLYPWGNSPAPMNCTYAAIGDCGGLTAENAHPLGAGPYGLLETLGNASEWVSDFFDPAYYAASPTTNPTGPAAEVSGNGHSVRGGDVQTISAFEIYQRANSVVGNPVLGFRCAASASP